MGWPVGVARGQLSPRAVTKLPTRPAVGERPTIPGRTDRPTWASRFVGAVVTPTNHHRAHPVSASPVTTAPAVIGTHDGVQQPLGRGDRTPGLRKRSPRPWGRLLAEGGTSLGAVVVTVEHRRGGRAHRRHEPGPFTWGHAALSFLSFDVGHKLVRRAVVVNDPYPGLRERNAARPRSTPPAPGHATGWSVSYTHLRAHETVLE